MRRSRIQPPLVLRRDVSSRDDFDLKRIIRRRPAPKFRDETLHRPRDAFQGARVAGLTIRPRAVVRSSLECAARARIGSATC